MQSYPTRRRVLHRWILFLFLVLALAACGDDDAATSGGDSPPTASPGASGSASAPSASEPADESEQAGDAAETTETVGETTATPDGEPVELTVGVPFGIVQIATLGSVAQSPELDGLAAATTVPITNPDELRTGFATGELDVAVMPTNVAAILFNREVDVRLIGIVDAQLLRVLGPAGTTWGDLDGATIHIPFPGDIADVTFRRLATDNGVDIDRLDLRYGTSLPDLVAAAAAGEVTNAVLPEHFASAAAAQASAAGHDLVPIIDLQEAWSTSTGGDRLPQVAVVATGSLVDDAPEVVAAIQAAAAASVALAADDPTIATALSEQTGLPEPLVTGVIGSLDLAYRSVPQARGDVDLLLAGLFEDSPDGLAGQLPAETFFGG